MIDGERDAVQQVTVRLEPMTSVEYDAWSARSRDGFAAQLVASGQMDATQARAHAEEQGSRLLPDGVATPLQHLWTVRTEDDAVVGHLWVEVKPDADGVVGGYVYDVELEPAARGRGLGKATMLAGERAAAGLGATRMGLNVFGHNEPARRLYDGLGYEVTATSMVKRLDAGDEGAVTATPDVPACPQVALRPMTPERYARFRVEEEAGYAENIARSGASGPEEARAKAKADFDRLLPDGLDSEGHLLWTAHPADAPGDAPADAPVDDEVGFLWVHVTERSAGKHAFGYDFAVRDDLRRHGYGRAVMRAAETVLRTRGVTSLGLSVFGFNAGARSLYEQEGFTVASESRVKALGRPEQQFSASVPG